MQREFSYFLVWILWQILYPCSACSGPTPVQLAQEAREEWQRAAVDSRLRLRLRTQSCRCLFVSRQDCCSSADRFGQVAGRGYDQQPSGGKEALTRPLSSILFLLFGLLGSYHITIKPRKIYTFLPEAAQKPSYGCADPWALQLSLAPWLPC